MARTVNRQKSNSLLMSHRWNVPPEASCTNFSHSALVMPSVCGEKKLNEGMGTNVSTAEVQKT